MSSSKQSSEFPRIYPAHVHQIDENLIDPDALYVMQRLHEAGFIAYLVGGSVRDLLLKKTPKDFDISTSARPEEIKRLFGRSCLLIGKRFRLAHIRFGHKVLEVSTFRSGENESHLIVHDNQWGNPTQDVLRRDFTINGLFYDSRDNTVIDYVGGWEDVKQSLLRTIGEPAIRFRQDPVRMIRLLKFQARLNFVIDKASHQALERYRDEIIKSAPARVLEEIFRMLESGAAAPFFRLMSQTGLLDLLFPCLDHFLRGVYGEEVFQFLNYADEYNKQNSKHPLDRAVLSACLIFPILEREIETQYLSKGVVPHISDIMLLADALVDGVVTTAFSHFPRRISASLTFILSTQYRLVPLSGKRHLRPKLIQNKEFALALHLLRIRAQIDPKLEDHYRAWRNAAHHLEKQGHESHHSPSKQRHKTRFAEKKKHAP